MGVAVIVLVMGELEVLVALKAAIFPFPEAAIPMLVLELVHE